MTQLPNFVKIGHVVLKEWRSHKPTSLFTERN